MLSSTPQIDPALPDTPSDEWAQKTNSALSPPSNSNSVTQEFSVSTPALDIPGAYPADGPSNPSESIYSQANPDTSGIASRGAKDTIHHTAEAYIASERLDQVEHLVEGVGSKAAQYVPAGVASAVSSYWYGTRQSSTSSADAESATAESDALSNNQGNGKALDRSQSKERVEKENGKGKESEKVVVESEKEVLGKGKGKAKEVQEKAPVPLPAEPEPRVEPTPSITTADPILAPAPASTPPIALTSQNTQAPYPTQLPTSNTAPDSIKDEGGNGGKIVSDAPASSDTVTPDKTGDVSGALVPFPAGAKDPEPVPTDGISTPLPATSTPAPATDSGLDPSPGPSDGAVSPAAEAPVAIQPIEPPSANGEGDGESAKEKENGEAKLGYDVSTPAPSPSPAPAPAPAPAPTTPSKPISKADGQYHPALLHPMNASYSPSTAFVSPPSKSPAASIKSKKEGDKEKHGLHHTFSFGHRHKRTSSITSASSVSTQGGGRRKVGFLDKVKGETKVIIGKIEHKPEKVEEGKRILRGEDKDKD